MSFIGRAFRKVVNVLSDIGGAIFGVGASMVPAPVRRAVGRAIQPQGPPLIRGPVRSPIYLNPSPLDRLDPQLPRLPGRPPVESPRYPNPSPLDRLDPRQPRLPGPREVGYETPEEIPSEDSGYDTPDEISSGYETPEEIPDEKEGKEEKGDIPDEDNLIEYLMDFKSPTFNDPLDRVDIPRDERKNIETRMGEEILRINNLNQAFDIDQYLRDAISNQERSMIEQQFSRFIQQFRENRRAQLVDQLLNQNRYSALGRLLSEGYDIDNTLYLGFINAISDLQYVVVGLYYPNLGIQYLPMNAVGLEAFKSKLMPTELVETVYVASDNWEQYLGLRPSAMIIESRFERPPFDHNVIPNRAVGFFPKLNVNPLGIDLSCIQIYRITDHPQYGRVTEDKMDPFPYIEHCLIWCLKYYGIEESVIQHIKMAYPLGAHLAKSKLQSIAKIIRRDILVSFFGKNGKIRRNTYLCECQPSGITLSLGIYDDHIFVNHTTCFSKAFIKADGIVGNYDPRGVGLDMIHLIKSMDKKGWFIYSGLVTRSSGSTLPAQAILSDNTIEDEQIVCQRRLKKESKVKPVIFVADFEADTCYEVSKQLKELIESKIKLEELIALGGSTIEVKKEQNKSLEILKLQIIQLSKQSYHTPLFAAIHQIDSPLEPVVIKHNDIVMELMNYIATHGGKSAIVYFHNLKYDFHLMLKRLKIRSICEKDGQYYNVLVKHKTCNIEFRDSYKMIPIALAKFGSTFKLGINKQEAIAYNYYTQQNKNVEYISIEEYLTYFNKEDEKKTFMKILQESENKFHYNRELGTFNPIAYYHHYLRYDCKVLALGLKIFRDQVLVINPNINMFNYMTISSLAHDIMIDSGAYQGVYKVQGCLRAFIHEAIYGGRVMVNPKHQKKWINEEIEDFDGVSLYPSAMHRLCIDFGIPLGKCKMMKCLDDVKGSTYYIVKIRITGIGKDQNMPMIAHKGDGSMKYLNVAPEGDIVVDKYTLEDWCKFHEISYTVISGVYWNEGYNKEMGVCIRRLFDMRLKVKREGNEALSNVLKLIMNSIYGKTMPKPIYQKGEIVNDIRWKKGEDDKWINSSGHLSQYIMNNYQTIKSYQMITDTIANVVRFAYDESFDLSHVGCMILSMSKRIMNEVFDVANTIGVEIFYQDTDSMHLLKRDVSRLAEGYMIQYNKNLIGEDLGQFHTDFEMKGCRDVYAIKSIFIDKKIYYDRLRGVKDGVIVEGDHKRFKGITDEGLMESVNKICGGSVEMWYDLISKEDRKLIQIDLAANGDKFMLTTDRLGGVYTKPKQLRRV
jgi:hypothetical protein